MPCLGWRSLHNDHPAPVARVHGVGHCPSRAPGLPCSVNRPHRLRTGLKRGRAIRGRAPRPVPASCDASHYGLGGVLWGRPAMVLRSVRAPAVPKKVHKGAARMQDRAPVTPATCRNWLCRKKTPTGRYVGRCPMKQRDTLPPDRSGVSLRKEAIHPTYAGLSRGCAGAPRLDQRKRDTDQPKPPGASRRGKKRRETRSRNSFCGPQRERDIVC